MGTVDYELVGADELRAATRDDRVPMQVRRSLAKILLGLTQEPRRGGSGYMVTALSGVAPDVYDARSDLVILVYLVDEERRRVLPIRWVLYY